LLNSFFQLSVGDLTLCPTCSGSYRPDKGSHDNGFGSNHNFSPDQGTAKLSELTSITLS
jgi:hypothetical protein